MTGERGTKVDSPTLDDEELDPRLNDPRVLAWFAEHVSELRRSASGNALLYQYLVAAFVIGLAAHAAGYLLRSVATTEPLGLFADLLYTLGWALWTGVVVVVSIQVVPEAKRRQIKRALDAYDALVREKARHGGDGDPTTT